MANKRISELTSYTTPISGDVLPINDTTNTTTKKVTVDNLFNILSSLFRVKDSTDPTKKVAFDVSGVTTGTTRTLTIPNANTTIVGTDTTQTLTNKTLTSPVINVGSDAEGDIYYRNSGGAFTRLPRGTDNHILKMNGNVPNWEAETTNANASTTVAGIVELATSSEVTAGTATGGTGAALVVTPDALAASTPVFNGSGITGITKLLNTVTTDVTYSSSTAENTLLSYSVPGNTLSTGNVVRVTLHVSALAATTTATATFRFKYGGTTLVTKALGGVETYSFTGKIEFLLAGAGTTSSQNGSVAMNLGADGYVGNGNLEPQYFAYSGQGTSAIDSTSSQTLAITYQASNNSASDNVTVSLITVEVLR